ncbi:MAG: hypothetical protein JSS67_09940 [Bacteroidetes bacterium]|nr:hypothetical protein [Bacteroidota bacterium]
MRKLIVLFLALSLPSIHILAQKIDSIYFHLYTDSLKKGVHNYINVDGKMENGRFFPLDQRQIIFWSDAGSWEGNDLIIDRNFQGEAIKVTATLRANPAIKKEILIYIKKKPDPDVLPPLK